MKTKRMLNVDFFNDSSFKIKLSNKAKLLYFYAITNADDKGFCNNIDEIVLILNANDTLFNNDGSNTLLTNNYETALDELLAKRFLFKFKGNHDNEVYLIRHWYIHNAIPKDRVSPSNYEKYLVNVILDDNGIYELKKIQCNTNVEQVCDKCDTVANTNKIKVNKSKLNNTNNNINNNSSNINNTDTDIIDTNVDKEEIDPLDELAMLDEQIKKRRT